jgi:hypothetical protein
MKMILILVAISIGFSNQVWCQLPAKCIHQNYWKDLIELSELDSNENRREFLKDKLFYMIESEVNEIDSEVGRNRFLLQYETSYNIELTETRVRRACCSTRSVIDSNIVSIHPYYLSLALFDNFAHVEHQGNYRVSIRHEEDSTFVIPAQPYRSGFTYQIDRDSFLMRLNKIENDRVKKYDSCTDWHRFIIEIYFNDSIFYYIIVPEKYIFYPTNPIDFTERKFPYYKRELLIFRFDKNSRHANKLFDLKYYFSIIKKTIPNHLLDNSGFYYSQIGFDTWYTTSIVW